MGLSNAERQRRFRERRRAAIPVEPPRPARPARSKPRPARWTAAVAELRTLQDEYQAWRDGLPEGLGNSRTGELLDGVCEAARRWWHNEPEPDPKPKPAAAPKAAPARS